jgi:hypothetical protein
MKYRWKSQYTAEYSNKRTRITLACGAAWEIQVGGLGLFVSCSSFLPSFLPLCLLQSRTMSTPQAQSLAVIGKGFFTEYQSKTPLKLKLIDVYLGYVLISGIIQFIYCLLVGTFPFNSFLSGFSATVGAFVLAGTIATHLMRKREEEEGWEILRNPFSRRICERNPSDFT